MKGLFCVRIAAVVWLSIVVMGCSKEGESPTGQAASPARGAARHAMIVQKLCPVMGKPIDKDVFTDFEGQRVYFCCAGCPDRFNDDPATYAPKLDEHPSGSVQPAGGAQNHSTHRH